MFSVPPFLLLPSAASVQAGDALDGDQADLRSSRRSEEPPLLTKAKGEPVSLSPVKTTETSVREGKIKTPRSDYTPLTRLKVIDVWWCVCLGREEGPPAASLLMTASQITSTDELVH